MEKQVDQAHYHFLTYMDHARFNSLYHQLRFVHEIAPNRILEIGPGGNYLRRLLAPDFGYTSVDLDPDLDPDIIGALPNLPIPDNYADLVLCFQVLEHIPFELFDDCLDELARLSSAHVVISIPYARYRAQCAVYLPRVKWLRFSLFLPRFFKRHVVGREHYWVLGKRGYSLNRVEQYLTRHFTILDVFSPFENPAHIFFKLRVKNIDETTR